MATLEDLRRLSLALPGAHEVAYKGDPWFNVGKKTFALFTDGRAIMKLDRGRQELLFEVRPQTFARCKVATVHWSWVELDHLDEAELGELVLEAWSQIVPKKVSRPFLGR
ncbi:MmcQ/YjbR family DNA-binding protein [Phenylobacterium soli]|uniref:MmcQ/YjbR family DNA-binding protein n=1 Tax=Phenylobacterium soli TaxID=2170551 RepID=A0A328AN32_9CAUL|nr:hypothetical protein DJ017_16620 [Phenylobacterium soli]